MFKNQKAVLKAGFTVNSENSENLKNSISEATNEEIDNKNDEWHLEIPSINLNAKIEEGTTKEIMDKFIGHFEESQLWVGNVCLAAHNRGYENNYFANLKNLQDGEIILYYYQNFFREYIVDKNIIIKDTDLSYIEDTEDNRITLITCVENEPNYRRCVQAIESNDRKEE